MSKGDYVNPTTHEIESKPPAPRELSATALRDRLQRAGNPEKYVQRDLESHIAALQAKLDAAEQQIEVLRHNARLK